jgi:TrmH RNA methyltransferase
LDDNRLGKKPKEDKIYGISSAYALFESRPDDIIRVYVRKGEEGRFKDILSEMARRRVLYRLVPNEEMLKISESTHHEGICIITHQKRLTPLSSFFAELDALTDNSSTNDMPILLLDGISNPHNIGAILRTAAFYGVRFVLLHSESRINLSGSLARVSEGGSEKVYFSKVNDVERIIKEFKDREYVLLASEVQDAAEFNATLYSEKLRGNKKIVLILGNEGLGVSSYLRENADFRVSIRGIGEIESLNVSVSTGVFLDSFFRRNQSHV